MFEHFGLVLLLVPKGVKVTWQTQSRNILQYVNRAKSLRPRNSTCQNSRLIQATKEWIWCFIHLQISHYVLVQCVWFISVSRRWFVHTFNKRSDPVHFKKPFGFVLATIDCFRLLLSCPHWFLSVSVAFAIAWWHKSDTCIYHLSTRMVNSKLHIYHPVCNLLSRYRIDKNTYDSMKNRCFWKGRGWL